MASTRMVICVSVVAVAYWVYGLSVALPSPNGDLAAASIDPEFLELAAGGKHGSAIPANLTGPYAMNDRLKSAKRLFKGKVLGSESVAVAPDGELIMLDRAGYVYRARKTGDLDYELLPDPLYIGPGRPLGFEVVDGGKTLLVCDSLKGLLRVSLATGSVEVLSNSVGGKPLQYVNDLDVASDGTVYFSSSVDQPIKRDKLGFYDTFRGYLADLMHGGASGQLLKYDPQLRSTTQLIPTGLSFANGVALAADESFVLVAETNNMRVLKYHLKSGETSVFIDRLPGFPDGVTRAEDGSGFWVPLITPPTPVRFLLGPYPRLRNLLAHLLDRYPTVYTKYMCGVFHKNCMWGAVLKVDNSGNVVDALWDEDGSTLAWISAVTEHDGLLFFGNLGGDFVSVLKYDPPGK